MTTRLSPRQRRFLQLHDAKPAPHAWEWLEDGPPMTWATMRAHRQVTNANGDVEFALISREDFHDLFARGLMAHPFLVTDAGRTALLPPAERKRPRVIVGSYSGPIHFVDKGGAP